jgi:hypothetical protein
MEELCYAECELCSVTNKLFMLSVVMVGVVMLSVVAPLFQLFNLKTTEKLKFQNKS